MSENTIQVQMTEKELQSIRSALAYRARAGFSLHDKNHGYIDAHRSAAAKVDAALSEASE